LENICQIFAITKVEKEQEEKKNQPWLGYVKLG
jgi:hypothetical protein